MEDALCGKVGVKCGRWNPTTEQMKVLTELFSAGLRTPTTEQIQMISSRLSSLGKIESKNVFYWFQNHKARERHHHNHHNKRRRQTSSPPLPLHHSDLSFSDISHHCNGSFVSTTRPAGQISSLVFTEEETNKPAYESHRGIKTLELFPISSAGYRFGADQDNTRSNPSVRNDDDAVGDLCFLQHAVDEHPLNLTLGFF